MAFCTIAMGFVARVVDVKWAFIMRRTHHVMIWSTYSEITNNLVKAGEEFSITRRGSTRFVSVNWIEVATYGMRLHLHVRLADYQSIIASSLEDDLDDGQITCLTLLL